MTPGKLIAEYRLAKGLTQYALAGACGLTRAAITRIEEAGGHGMTLESFRRICGALEVDPAEFLAKLPPLESVDPNAPRRGRGRPRKEAE
jgi:transcriptional regulator with XRE-family HTH domain